MQLFPVGVGVPLPSPPKKRPLSPSVICVPVSDSSAVVDDGDGVVGGCLLEFPMGSGVVGVPKLELGINFNP